MQLARWGGARVIATARGAGLERCLSAGADVAIDYTDPDLSQSILAANDGRPVDRIIEPEFGVNIATDAEVIAANGTLVAYGSAKDMAPTVPFGPLLFKAVTVRIALVYILTDQERRESIDLLTKSLTDGALDCPVDQVFDLPECAAAHEAVERGNRSGAILVRAAI